MSRVAKYPISVSKEVNVEIRDQQVTLTSHRGSLHQSIPPGIAVQFLDQQLRVAPLVQTRKIHCLAGTIRANLNNQVQGVSEGFTCALALVGVGYRAQLQGSNLILNVGFSQPKSYPIPKDITIKLPVPTEIVIEGLDIQQVYQVAAIIRKIRPIEPYQGTGIRLKGQEVKLKTAKKK